MKNSICLGILDGPEGFLFHFLQGFWLRLMVDVRLGELEREASLQTKGKT